MQTTCNRYDHNMKTEQLTRPHTFTSGIEGPAVDRFGHLYAVNYARPHTIGRIAPNGDGEIFIELPDGSIGNGIRFNRAGDMLIADYVHHNIWRVEMASRTLTVYAHEPRMNQPNDIAISGNDIVFASDPNWGDDTGNVWRILPDGTVTLLESGMGTTNGIEVSYDERTLYVNESVQRRVWAYDLTAAGTIDNKRLLIQFDDFGLDGMRCDVAGNLYVTRYGKGTIVCLSPDGVVLDEIELTGQKPTNVAFGGVDGRTLYITLADRGNVERVRVPHGGRAWAMRL